MSWAKPLDAKCPKCGSIMLEKGNKQICSDEQCGYLSVKEQKNKKVIAYEKF